MKIKDMPDSSRPRESFLRQGAGALRRGAEEEKD
jgi:DNA repair protein RadC